MRRILVWLVLGVLLAWTAGAAPEACAQQQSGGREQEAAEFNRLWTASARRRRLRNGWFWHKNPLSWRAGCVIGQ